MVALILFVIVGPAAALTFLAIRGVFSADDQSDQSWTAPRSTHPSNVISIRTRRAA